MKKVIRLFDIARHRAKELGIRLSDIGDQSPMKKENEYFPL